MAYFHCRRQIRTHILTQILILCRIFGSDSDSDPLIEMYVTGTEDLSLGCRSDLKMGTVTIQERDLNQNPSPSPSPS